MDWTMILTVAGLAVGVVGLIGIPISIYSLRKSHPRRSLRYAVTVTPLISNHAGVANLEVSIGQTRIQNPYLLEIVVVSHSRADIVSASFDSGVPIQFRVHGADEAIVTSQSSSDGIVIEESWSTVSSEALLEIHPQLIRPGALGRATVVTAGPAEVDVSDKLIDIKVRDRSTDEFIGVTSFWLRNVSWLLPSGAASVGVVAALIAGILGATQ
ncbi:hypothetical protein [Pseudoclavibacter sp. 8L]|uniref:hypothetical protein n=1 Tax=Pseudoclavibacter sp. 8L TaxID=2653162 RepID=UPI0012F08CCF|nr:hypothetical protein [Pseudoclavibacter sp. 8L]VXB29549.1 conserved hypothetical protein [Pseudoclavibacter sp. 8L]